MASYRQRGRTWYYRITTYVLEHGAWVPVKVERKGRPTLPETKALARAAEDEAAKLRAGLVDASELAFQRHAAASLYEHLDAWRNDLDARGNTEKHVHLHHDRAARIVALIAGASLATIDPGKVSRKELADAWNATEEVLKRARLGDLQPDRVQAALDALRRAGRSLATLNHHRGAIRSFARWLVDTGRLPRDPLRGVRGFNAAEDRRHDRRTLSTEDMRRLIQVANDGGPYQRMTGPDRALCYRVAVAAGLRLAEMTSLTPRSFDLRPGAASVFVAARAAKNRRDARLPIPEDVRVDLAAYISSIDPEAPVFPLPAKGAAMLRVDLDAAGIAYRDDAGQVFDFHALRCQLATEADRAGVSPRVIQRMMRHSTLELSGRYTRPRLHDLEGAAAALPSLAPTTAPPTTEAATGTNGQPIRKLFAHYLPTGDAARGHFGSDTGGMEHESMVLTGEPQTPKNKARDVSVRAVSGGVVSSGDETRTRDLRVMNPLL